MKTKSTAPDLRSYSSPAIKIVLMILLTTLLSCSNKKASKISIDIIGCDNNGPQQIRLYNPLTNEVVDSLNITGNHITWHATVRQPGVYVIWAHCTAKNEPLNTQVYLPTDSIQINAFVGGNLLPAVYQNSGLGKYHVGSYLMKSKVISTALQQQELANYLRTRDSIWNHFYLDLELAKSKMNTAMNLQQKEQIDYWGDSTRRIQERFPQYEVKAVEIFIKKHPNSEINLYALNNIGGSEKNKKYLEHTFKRLSTQLQESSNGHVIQEKFMNDSSLRIGQPAPDFTLLMPDGRPIALRSYRGKYVLVDFWASWCGPCRAENPNIVRVYETYKDRNFDVLSISIDSPNAKSKWLKAVQDDKLPWTQVLDGVGPSRVAALYRVEIIPENFLLDPNGNIIAFNLRGEALQTAISRLVK